MQRSGGSLFQDFSHSSIRIRFRSSRSSEGIVGGSGGFRKCICGNAQKGGRGWGRGLKIVRVLAKPNLSGRKPRPKNEMLSLSFNSWQRRTWSVWPANKEASFCILCVFRHLEMSKLKIIILEGSCSAVPKPICASKHPRCRIFRDLHDLRSFALLETQFVWQKR